MNDLRLATVDEICMELRRRRIPFAIVAIDPNNTDQSKHSPPFTVDFDTGNYSGNWLLGALDKVKDDILTVWRKTESDDDMNLGGE